jgi:hypothetical protein
MLDKFLEVLYSNETLKQQSVKLASDLKRLPNEQLYALATGQEKLSFGHDEDWLEKYRGTELFDQAMALEKASLENEVAQSQADAARPQMNQFHDTADQIRIQKKMLDLQLVEHQEGGAPMQAGGQLPEVVPGAAQGAGALGDMASEGASDGAIGMQGKMGSAFQKVALMLADEALAGYLGHQKAKARGENTTEGAVRGAGGYLGGGLAGGLGGYHLATKKYNKEASARFEKAALSASNIGAIGGVLGGGLLGAASGGPDEYGRTHRLRNALLGAGGGAALGHAGAGIGSQMVGQNAKSFRDAAGAYGTGVKNSVTGAFSKKSPAAAPGSPDAAKQRLSDLRAHATSEAAKRKVDAPLPQYGRTDLPPPPGKVVMPPSQGNVRGPGVPAPSPVPNKPAPAPKPAPSRSILEPTYEQKQEAYKNRKPVRTSHNGDEITTHYDDGSYSSRNKNWNPETKSFNKEVNASANFDKAAMQLGFLEKDALAVDWGGLGKKVLDTAKAHPALIGAGVGAAGGALAGGPDHRLSGALAGGALGAGVGHAGGGIATRMGRGSTFGEATKGYATNLKRRAQVGVGKAKRWVPRKPGEVAAAPAAATPAAPAAASAQQGLPGIA